MSVFRVWAPEAGQAAVRLGERQFPMQRQTGGWWRADVPQAMPGSDYAFILDGGLPLPDPRSPWQPQGVHGPSRLVDHSAFEWTDAGFQARPLSSAVIYELHVGTFTAEGTFEAAISRLPHLVELGITHVELMPVAAFSGSRGWGYDGVDLFAPHQEYGGPEGLKRLVDACHARGLAVLLDVVYNHLGPDGNYLGQYGPYLTDRYSTPWGQAINFDGPGSEEVRRFFIDNALMWLRDYHMDGLRLDAVHAILDSSSQHFLEQLAVEVDALQAHLGRRLVLIAESDLNDPRLVLPLEAGGYGLDAQWSDDFHHALFVTLTGERLGYYQDFAGLEDLAEALERTFVYAGRYSNFRRRRHGRPAGSLPAYRFLGYLQNHDQVGNRAQGERASQLLDVGRLQIGAALVLTAPFVPMLFMGEEWGASTPFQYFTDYQDQELGRAVSRGRREEFAPFGWQPEQVPDPQSPETFQRSRLDWQEAQSGDHARLLDWHRRLIELRRQEPALSAGRFQPMSVRCDPRAGWLLMKRGPVRVACNLGESAQPVPLGGEKGWEILLASTPPLGISVKGVELRPDSVAILRAGGRDQ